MSLLKKTWRILNENTHINPLKKIYQNRGLKTESEIQKFIQTNPKDFYHDPYLFKDMKKSVQRIKKAIKNEERIMIFGDYDVDGISSTAILFITLNKLGALVSYRLPHRIADGYGLNDKVIEDCKKVKSTLLITTDCGTANIKEIDYANKEGIDVIVTDHHSIPPVLPKAFTILNPKLPNSGYPFSGICGAGVAYKLATAIIYEYFPKDKADEFIFSLMDIVALGTVADVSPLIDENRYFVKEGLKKLRCTKHKGLQFLMEKIGIDVNNLNTESIGFQIGPRLNASGRLSSAYYSLQVLLGKEENVLILEKLNQKRKKITEECLRQIEKMIGEVTREKKILIAYHRDWHVGIIGLLAGKITEKYFRPSIVMQEKDEYLIGSARSIPSVNIMAILETCRDLFLHFGGHKQAAGFSLPKHNLEHFLKKIDKIANTSIEKDQLQPFLEVDTEIHSKDINLDTFKDIQNLAPFGVSNTKPVLLLKNAKIEDIKTVGSENRHLKLRVKSEDKFFDVIGFKFGQFLEELEKHEKLDLVFQLDLNKWNGNEKLQLKMIDAKI